MQAFGYLKYDSHIKFGSFWLKGVVPNRALELAHFTLNPNITLTQFSHPLRRPFKNRYVWHYIELGSAYDNNALKVIKTRVAHPKVFVFSNDITWCEQHFLQSLNSKVCMGIEFEFIQGNSQTNAAEEMELMKSCKHTIIANSTFSWWTAYLIDHRDKFVCMPRYIFCNPHYIPGDLAEYLQCPCWILINHIWQDNPTHARLNVFRTRFRA